MKKLLIIMFTIISVTFLSYKTLKRETPIINQNNIHLLNQDGSLPLNEYYEKEPGALRNVQIPNTFSYVTENDNYVLYIEEDTLAFAVTVKSSDYTWFSYDVENPMEGYSINMQRQFVSGISLFTYSKGTLGRRTVLDNNVTIDYYYDNDTLKAEVDFRDYMIKLSLYLTLEEDGLVIDLPANEIVEYDQDLFKPSNVDVLLSKVEIYPFFGTTTKQDDGYIVIPDGSGAIVELKDDPTYKLAYSQPVYGKDNGYEEDPILDGMKQSVKQLPRITLPIYGIIHETNKEGALVNLIEGAEYATYKYNSKGLTTDYYQSFFEFMYRNSYKQYQSRTDKGLFIFGFQRKPNQFNIKQKIHFLHNEKANYVGLAKTYKDYLEKEKDFNQQLDNSVYNIGIDMIGLEVEKGIFRNKLVVASPFNKVLELLKEMKVDALTQLDLSYRTFNLKSYTYDFNLSRKLGNKKSFNQLINYLEEEDIMFNYYGNYAVSYKQSKETASKLNGHPLTLKNDSQMFEVKSINKTSVFYKKIKQDAKNLNKYNFDSVILDGLNEILYTHQTKGGKVSYRNNNVDVVIDALSYLKEKDFIVSATLPDSYVLPYIDKYYNMPYSSSEQMFISASIPLLQLVVSGKIEKYSPVLNSFTNEDDIMLRLIEYGINPSFIMTTNDIYNIKYSNSSHVFTSEYRYLKSRIKNYDNMLNNILNKTSHLEIINHKFISSGVVEVTYENNLKIIVNYNNEDINVNGNLVPKKGYVEL